MMIMMMIMKIIVRLEITVIAQANTEVLHVVSVI